MVNIRNITETFQLRSRNVKYQNDLIVNFQTSELCRRLVNMQT